MTLCDYPLRDTCGILSKGNEPSLAERLTGSLGIMIRITGKSGTEVYLLRQLSDAAGNRYTLEKMNEERTTYIVFPPRGRRATCDCPDWQYRQSKTADGECKHIQATRLVVNHAAAISKQAQTGESGNG